VGIGMPMMMDSDTPASEHNCLIEVVMQDMHELQRRHFVFKEVLTRLEEA